MPDARKRAEFLRNFDEVGRPLRRTQPGLLVD